MTKSGHPTESLIETQKRRPRVQLLANCDHGRAVVALGSICYRLVCPFLRRREVNQFIVSLESSANDP